MAKSLIHKIFNFKHAILWLLLVLTPCAFLSYLSFQSISRKTESLKGTYHFAIELVRDRVESEIIRREEKAANFCLSHIVPALIQEKSALSSLEQLEIQHALIQNPFLINKNGGIKSSYISWNWQGSENSSIKANDFILPDFRSAEEAEFAQKDYQKAISHYMKAYTNAGQKDSILITSRIGRCYYKMKEYNNGIREYKSLLKYKDERVYIGVTPVYIVALIQIADGYQGLNDQVKRFYTLLELLGYIVNNPINVEQNEYVFLLRDVKNEILKLKKQLPISAETAKALDYLFMREMKIDEHKKLLMAVYRREIPELISNSESNQRKELEIYHSSFHVNDSTYYFGSFNVPDSKNSSGPLQLAYQINSVFVKDSILFPLLNRIDLGGGLKAIILDEKDSIIYSALGSSNANILMAENFSKVFSNWKIALVDRSGKTMDQLISTEKQQSLLLFGGTLFVLIIGILVVVIAARQEYRLSRMKSDFVSNVSHELKTPLSLIRMFIETLESGIVHDENRKKEFYSIIKRESLRLDSLIDNVLDFSRIEEGRKNYNFEETEVVGMVREITSAYKEQITGKGFNLELILPEEEINSYLDKDSISQALINLLSNAVKYSESVKRIAVEVSSDRNSVTISVRDMGIGIPERDLNRIFDKFYRVPAATNSYSQKGTGLGLTIAKYIVESHKGKIVVNSTQGAGSKFSIILPLSNL